MKDETVELLYGRIIHGMDPQEVEAIQKKAFNLEVDAVAEELTKWADHIAAEHFDAFVVAAALHKVWQDYDHVVDAAVGDDE